MAADILQETAGRRVAGTEPRERVALQYRDRAGDQERQPHGRSGDLAGRPEQCEDPRTDHRADTDERGLADSEEPLRDLVILRRHHTQRIRSDHRSFFTRRG
jgi:hypothetical protein